MPLIPGGDVGVSIKELQHGPRYRKAVKKRGKKAANRQALATLKNSRLANKRKPPKATRRMAKR